MCSDFRADAPTHSHTAPHAQPKLDSMTSRPRGQARSRPYWPRSAAGSCCRSAQRICGDRREQVGEEGDEQEACRKARVPRELPRASRLSRWRWVCSKWCARARTPTCQAQASSRKSTSARKLRTEQRRGKMVSRNTVRLASRYLRFYGVPWVNRRRPVRWKQAGLPTATANLCLGGVKCAQPVAFSRTREVEVHDAPSTDALRGPIGTKLHVGDMLQPHIAALRMRYGRVAGQSASL